MPQEGKKTHFKDHSEPDDHKDNSQDGISEDGEIATFDKTTNGESDSDVDDVRSATRSRIDQLRQLHAAIVANERESDKLHTQLREVRAQTLDIKKSLQHLDARDRALQVQSDELRSEIQTVSTRLAALEGTSAAGETSVEVRKMRAELCMLRTQMATVELARKEDMLLVQRLTARLERNPEAAESVAVAVGVVDREVEERDPRKRRRVEEM